MPLRVEAAVAAPLWGPLSYAVPGELASAIQPLTRLAVPLRGRQTLAFALSRPEEGDTAGLKKINDVLDDPGQPQVLPPGLLGFFQRAAAYYNAPLGQALAWSLPAGMGTVSPQDAPRPAAESVAVAAFRGGDPSRQPKSGSRAAQLLERLRADGPTPLPRLRADFPQATRLCRDLESAGWVAISHQPLVRDVLGRLLLPEPEPEHLTEAQQSALDALLPAMDQESFTTFLLYGVTGSGKTEVYLRACAHALASGKGALVLTPEIGLALRLEGLARQRLGSENVAVLHSGLGPAARRGQWREIASGRARVVVGARSAVFAPLEGLGVICVDEEQDEAYKQEDRLRYNGRDLAILRAQEQGCPVIMGTATPSPTTYYRAKAGAVNLLPMPNRVGGATLPEMEVVDLRSAGRLEEGFLSRRLHGQLSRVVAGGGQAVLFLNRRGFAPALLCPDCGKTVGCPDCSLSLTLHRAAGRLDCHTCGHIEPLPEQCPHCGAPGGAMLPMGLGTEAVADALARLEPGMRIARLDRDTAGSATRLRQVLRLVADHEVDVVVGTQMITKGHHFPRIALVGVLLADQAFSLPDFRAAERAYTLLTQAGGRAGRGETPGRVIVQTYDPQHHAVRAAVAHDAELFYEEELAERRVLGYPPFMRLTSLRLESADARAASDAAADLAARLREAAAQLAPNARVLGPAPAPVAKAQGRFRWLILLKAPQASAASRLLSLGLHRLGQMPSGVRLVVDVDPMSLV